MSRGREETDFISQFKKPTWVLSFIHPFSHSPLLFLTSTLCCPMEKFLHENCCLMRAGLHLKDSCCCTLFFCMVFAIPSAAPPAGVFNYIALLLLIKLQPPNATATVIRLSVLKQEEQSCRLGGVEFPAAPSERRPLAPLMWSQRGWLAWPGPAHRRHRHRVCVCVPLSGSRLMVVGVPAAY